jgi:hypothetical protein
MRCTGKYLLLLFVLFPLFYWKVVFTGQFSVSEDWEAANQGYAWHQFAVRSIQNGSLPLWDPYTQSGRSHVGELQPGVFYPLKLILYLWPLGESGNLSPRLFDQYHVLARFLAACFLFLLARQLGLKNALAAVVAAFCFGAGGFVGNVGGLQLLDSAVWLPLALLFLVRALCDGKGRRGLFFACLSGACISMTILAGSIHLPIMDTIVLVTAAWALARLYSQPLWRSLGCAPIVCLRNGTTSPFSASVRDGGYWFTSFGVIERGLYSFLSSQSSPPTSTASTGVPSIARRGAEKERPINKSYWQPRI